MFSAAVVVARRFTKLIGFNAPDQPDQQAHPPGPGAFRAGSDCSVRILAICGVTCTIPIPQLFDLPQPTEYQIGVRILTKRY